MPRDTRKVDSNLSVAQKIDVTCIRCKCETKHAVLASIDLSGEDFVGGGGSVQYWKSHQIVQCQGCETTSFRVCSANSEDIDFDDDGKPYHAETVELFPNRNEGRASIRDTHLLPVSVQRIYGESLIAMNSRQPVLTGIGIRALVETVCKDKQAIGKNLVEKIDSLVQLGVLTPDGAAILHKIRTLGNDAAHEVKPHTAEQLGLALDVCEHLLLGVYILPHHSTKTFQ